MRTLYIRFVAIMLTILCVSTLTAFLFANVYYHMVLKPYNDKKITQIAKDITTFYEQNSHIPFKDYLRNIADVGYQLYVTNGKEDSHFYGGDFRVREIKQQVINDVIKGNEYHGINQFPTHLFITGFFDNNLHNSIGVPIHTDKGMYAVFIRPDIKKQFGELRVFLVQIIIISIVIMILLIFIGTRYVVRPVLTLTNATKKIAQGNYNIVLDVDRKDEIGTLATSFTQMTESLKQLEEMRQEFVSNVSHEIQSPLTSIRGFSQMLQTEQLTEEQQVYYLSIIEEESNRLSLMSKQLLMLASLDKEADILEWTHFDVSKEIKQIVYAIEWQWREKDLSIELNTPTLFIRGDKHFLHHVWMNLLQNSIKFTEPYGSISVSVDMIHDTRFSFRIEDTGIGMDEENTKHIFERYYKVDKSRKRTKSGSGLGLSIVKKIVDIHGGTIEVTSELGKGTTFEVQIPMM